jgi:hypothetical protein
MKVARSLLAIALLGASASQASSDANAEFDELYKQSEARAVGRPVAEVLFQLARERASSGNSKFTNMGQLANYLADDFTLYSNLHAEIVRDHCKMRGTNISTYLADLADESTADATVARKI